MKMSDILRTMADKMDAIEGGSQSSEIDQATAQTDVQDATAQSHAAEPQLDKMVPPLQQKLELLKKVTGVDNEFDNASQSQPDELDRMKQMAGIQFADQEDHE